jgi:hypothetical protein
MIVRGGQGSPGGFLGFVHVLPRTTVREIRQRVVELLGHTPSWKRLDVKGSLILDSQAVGTLGLEDGVTVVAQCQALG